MKTRRESLRDKSTPSSAPAKPDKSRRPSSDSGWRVSEKPAAAKDYKTAFHSYRFQRSKSPGIIEVLNENSYVMAEYSERTGSLKWQRLVLASQRDQIEKWLGDHYPKE